MYRVEANAKQHAHFKSSSESFDSFLPRYEKAISKYFDSEFNFYLKLKAKIVEFVRHALRESASCVGWKQFLVYCNVSAEFENLHTVSSK